MKKILITLSMTLLVILPSLAKPLDLTKISLDANWLAHMDFDAMRKSEVGSFIRSSMEKIPEVIDRMNRMKEAYGVDLDNFSYLTMSGSGERDKGIAILQGGLDLDTLLDNPKYRDRLELNLIGKHKVYTSDKGRRPMAFAALKKGIIIGGSDTDYVSEGINLAKGKSNYYKGHDLLQDLILTVDQPGFLFFADLESAKLNNNLDQRAKFMTDKVKVGGIVIGEASGAIRITAVVETINEETSVQMEAMFRGGLAMIDLRKSSDKRLAEVLENYSVRRKANMIWVEIDLSGDAIMEHIQKEMRKSA
jgi:hypothetical protein